MILYLNGQDIRNFTIGVLEVEPFQIVKTIKSDPKDFLLHINDFLKSNNRKIKDVKKIIVVVGPGSATSLRSILSIVNTIRFTQEIEVAGIEKDPLEKDSEILKKIDQKKVEFIKSEDILLPKYAHGPRITISKKDNLGQ